MPTQLDPLNIDDVEQTFRVNLLGVVYSIEAVLPGMLARARQLVAVSSLAAYKGLPGESAYCASKAAVNVLHGGPADRPAEAGDRRHDRLPGVRRHADGSHGRRGDAVLMSAEAAARRIARLIVGRQVGPVSFPWPMAVLMA